MRVFINPGHSPNGNPDPGACNPNSGLRECDVALKIGNRVSTYLQNAGIETKVFQFDGLAKITSEADYYDADLFVSIHCNAANRVARGTETYHYYGSAKGKQLATAIHNQIISAIPTDYKYWNRGVKEAGFYVIKYTSMPAVLVETAFIDNDADANLLVKNEDEFAKAIAAGICEYCGIPIYRQQFIKPDAVVKTVIEIRSDAPISEETLKKVSDIFRESLCPNESMFSSIPRFKSFNNNGTVIIGGDGGYSAKIEF